MKIEKKHIIAGFIGLVSVTAAFTYWQYKKLMNYKISFKTLRVKTLSATKINFDVFLNFINNADISFKIVEQQYQVFMNGKFVTKMSNNQPTLISAKNASGTPSIIGVNITFNPTKVLNLLGQNYISIITKPETIMIKMDINLKVSLYGIKFSIPITIEKSLKELMEKKPTEEVPA